MIFLSCFNVTGVAAGDRALEQGIPTRELQSQFKPPFRAFMVKGSCVRIK
jgi:hypothetical protein